MSFDSDQNKIHEDYYTFLGISKNATDTEITNAYRRLSRLYHPDKHQEHDKKDAANVLFYRTNKAYEVLKDPLKRAIYDALGENAIDSEMYEIVKRQKSPEEIRKSYEKLLKDKEEKQLKQFLNPRGTVTLGINAISLFKKKKRKRDHVKLSSMGLTAAIDLPINNRNRLTVSGLVTSNNKNGEHSFTVAMKNNFSEDLNTEFRLSAGQNNFLKFRGMKNITKRDLIGTSLVFSPEIFRFFSKEINYVHLLSKYLAFNCALKTDLIDNSSLISTLSYNKEKNKIDLEFMIGIKNSYLSLSYIRSLDINDTKLKTKFKYSSAGLQVEYGCETKLTKYSSVEGIVSFGNLLGVNVNLSVFVFNHAYTFDILLSDTVILGPIIYGTVCPMLVYLCVEKYLIKPYQDSHKKQKIQEDSQENIQKLSVKRREAELSVQLMQVAYARCVQNERAKDHGLIIDVAIYGNAKNLHDFVNKNIRDVPNENVELNDLDELESKQLILVTIPLQVLIKDSMLLLPEGTKSNLPGFFDPCPNREKKLYIRFKFKGVLKDIFCYDNGKMRLPSFN